MVRLIGLAAAGLAGLVMVLGTIAHAQQSPDGRMSITNGRAPSRPYPFMALVRTLKPSAPGGYYCGGTLIAARWVLTAGHCVFEGAGDAKAAPDKVRVVIGQTSVQTQLADQGNAEWRAVNRVELHPSYAETPANASYDVALLQLSSPVVNAQARLPRPLDAPLWAPGTPAAIIGFGKTASERELSPSLLETDLAIRPDTECRTANGVVDLAVTICAMSGGPGGACQGDSGGPLLVAGTENVLAGVTSFAHTACQGLINGFARVGADPLNPFIRSIVPQAEIDLSPAGPQPGDTVTMRAAARNPYGPYSSLRWDLNADGAFDDAQGASVSRTLALGQYRVGLEASDGAGNREVRYITVDVRPRTPINLIAPRPPARVREGRPVRIRLSPGAAGSGTIGAVVAPGSAKARRDFDPAPLQVPIGFAVGETEKTLLIPTREDWRPERRERFRVSLASPTGQLTIGTDSVRDITIVDDDVVGLARGRTIRVRGGRARVRIRARRRTRVTVALERRGSAGVTPLGSVRRRVRHGTHTLRFRLARAGRRLAARGRGTDVHVTLLVGGDPVGPPLKRRLVG